MGYNTLGFFPFFDSSGRISARYLPPMQGGDTATWETLEGRPEVVSAGSTKAEARSSIDAASIAQGNLADSAIQAAGLTKEAVGLSNVDNTSDANKPLPVGVVLFARYNGAWPARPTARTDILVHWIGSVEATPPPGALTGDLWDRETL